MYFRNGQQDTESQGKLIRLSGLFQLIVSTVEKKGVIQGRGGTHQRREHIRVEGGTETVCSASEGELALLTSVCVHGMPEKNNKIIF